MRMTKANLIDHIKSGRVVLQWDRYSLTFDGVVHPVTDGQIDRLGGMVGIEGDSRTVGPRKLFIR
jgi:hypothetical protein